jgi:hypothetical protein
VISFKKIVSSQEELVICNRAVQYTTEVGREKRGKRGEGGREERKGREMGRGREREREEGPEGGEI